MGFLTFLSSPSNKIDFTYKLGGEPQEINVFELAPTLLSLGELIQEGNRTLYPERNQIAVNVRPFKGGSFIVEVVLFPLDLNSLWNAAQHISHEQVMGVLTALGLISTAADRLSKAGSSVLKLIRELGDKPKTVEELKPGEFRYTTEDHKSVTVGRDVHTLIQNPTIVTNIYNVYAKPLENESVEDVETYLDEGEAESASKVTVTREDVPTLKAFAEAAAEHGKEHKDNTRTMRNVFLNPKRGAYSGDGKQWSFFRGKNTITATIKDEKFLRQMESGEIRMHYKDLLTVTMVEKQKVVGTKVTVSYEIISVDDYETGGRQQELTRELPAGKERKALPPASEDSSGE